MGLFSLFRRKKDAEPEAALEADEIVSPETLTEALDLTTFWHDSAESDRRHLSAPFDDEMLKSIEEELGYKLPASFVMLMRTHNGGLVNRCRYRVPDPKEGMPDTVYITDILGIGRDAPYSLCGRFGSEFLIDSRRHNKEIGIAVCNTTLPGRARVPRLPQVRQKRRAVRHLRGRHDGNGAASLKQFRFLPERAGRQHRRTVRKGTVNEF